MSLHNHRTDVFFDINGIDVSPIQLHILTCMLENLDHEWCLSETQQPGTREALDWLVLGGVIERYKDPDGAWDDLWKITPPGLEWAGDPETGADMSLAKSASEMLSNR